MPHLGRWASADPLQTHGGGGGEFGNSYHYVAGNVLQARDPWGLNAYDFIEYHKGRGFSAAESMARSFAHHGVDATLGATAAPIAPGSQFGHATQGFARQGFRSEIHDGTQNQVGHFLTAVALGRRPQLLADRPMGSGTPVAEVLAPGRRDYRTIAIQLIVGHEAVADPGNAGRPTPMSAAFRAMFDGGLSLGTGGASPNLITLELGPAMEAAIGVYRSQFEAGARGGGAAIDAFSSAVDYIKGLGTSGTIDYDRLDEILRPAYERLSLPSAGDPRSQPGGSRAGNSIEDLRNSAVGFAFGEMESSFESPAATYSWMQRNVIDED